MKTRLLYTVILICSITFFSCSGQSKDSDSIITVEDSVNADENFKAALREQLSEISDVNKRAEKEQEEIIERMEKQLKEEERDSRFKELLQGTWEYQGDGVYIDYYNVKIKVLMGGEIVYDGSYEIDDDKLIYDRGNGYYSSLDIDWEGKCIGDFRHGIRFTKVSEQDELRTKQKSRNQRRNNRSSNYSSSSTFRTDQDVYMYLSSHRFTSDGLTLSFGNGGTVMYSKGNPLSNAMRVVQFSSQKAVLSYTSPYSPGTKYITIDNRAGTLTDGSGEVYYSR